MSTNTFMDWEAGTDWTVIKPNANKSVTADANSTINLGSDGIINTDFLNSNGTNVGTQNWLDTKISKVMQNNNNITADTNINADASGMFSSENIGGTLQGIGAIGNAIAGVYGAMQKKKFNEDMVDMEKDRIARINKKVDKQQANYDAVWG